MNYFLLGDMPCLELPKAIVLNARQLSRRGASSACARARLMHTAISLSRRQLAVLLSRTRQGLPPLPSAPLA